jgi:hypothetical protein
MLMDMNGITDSFRTASIFNLDNVFVATSPAGAGVPAR